MFALHIMVVRNITSIDQSVSRASSRYCLRVKYNIQFLYLKSIYLSSDHHHLSASLYHSVGDIMEGTNQFFNHHHWIMMTDAGIGIPAGANNYIIIVHVYIVCVCDHNHQQSITIIVNHLTQYNTLRDMHDGVVQAGGGRKVRRRKGRRRGRGEGGEGKAASASANLLRFLPLRPASHHFSRFASPVVTSVSQYWVLSASARNGVGGRRYRRRRHRRTGVSFNFPSLLPLSVYLASGGTGICVNYFRCFSGVGIWRSAFRRYSFGQDRRTDRHDKPWHRPSSDRKQP